MPLWPKDYFELKVFENSQYRKGILASSFLPESRRESTHVKDALLCQEERNILMTREQGVEAKRILYKQTLLQELIFL